MNDMEKDPEPVSSTRLLDIVDKAELGIAAIRAAEKLLSETYGAGCVNLHSHHDSDEIAKAAQTLVVHLSWLKSRAAALAMLPEASVESKKRLACLLR